MRHHYCPKGELTAERALQDLHLHHPESLNGSDARWMIDLREADISVNDRQALVAFGQLLPRLQSLGQCESVRIAILVGDELTFGLSKIVSGMASGDPGRLVSSVFLEEHKAVDWLDANPPIDAGG